MTELCVFPNLPIEESSGHQFARVCIATYEILGPSENGGIGTAYFSLATTLASTGHDVTILHLSSELSDRDAIEHWTIRFHTLGIRFVALPATPRMINVPQCMLTARDAYAWLRKQEFDVIHFPELQGHGYYSVVAKHQGLDFSHTTLCIGTHSPISWIREQNREAPDSPDELEMDFMERQCVALADVVLSPSQYMLRWMQSRGWTLPAECYVQQNIPLPELKTSGRVTIRGDGEQRASELVFFGKLEERKGIGLFCDALDLLAGRNLRRFSVTFLGKSARVSGRDAISYIGARAEHWAFPYRAITDRGREAALRYLSEGADRIAIIPSLEDNLPNTVAECLAGNIPFLASRTGGIPELIADPDVERVTFPPNASELADTLDRALRDGITVARPAVDADRNKRRWVNWHAALASRRVLHRHAQTEISATPVTPLVSICLNYREGVASLLHAVGSLRRQNWPNLEVILTDCSGAGVGAQSELDGLRSDFESRGWQIIRAAEGNPRTMRTTAVVRARGDYVLFMDGASYATPDAVATFVEVAGRTGADILTCFLAFFSGVGEPNDESVVGHCLFLGAAILLGVFRNQFGSRCIFVRKDEFSRLVSHCGEGRVDCSDWEFLARATLTGSRLEVVPRPLVWYRVPDGSGLQRDEYYGDSYAVRPYAEAMPFPLRDLPNAAFTMKIQYEQQYGLASECRELLLSRDEELTVLRELLSSRDEELAMLLMKRLTAHGRGKIASLLAAWIDYSATRSNLPESRIQRIPLIARQLLRGRYHRFSHGLGSAFRDLRKPPPVWFQVKTARNNLRATNCPPATVEKKV
jgi:glycosyltransferase involved in cell wall biosynthesis